MKNNIFKFIRDLFIKTKETLEEPTPTISNDCDEEITAMPMIPIMLLKESVRIIDIPANKYFIVNMIRTSDYIQGIETSYARFVFKINETGSHKVDDISCCGKFITKFRKLLNDK